MEGIPMSIESQVQTEHIERLLSDKYADISSEFRDESEKLVEQIDNPQQRIQAMCIIDMSSCELDRILNSAHKRIQKLIQKEF